MLTCRSCSSNTTQSIFSFGLMPLPNRSLKSEQLIDTEPRYNLEIMLCNNCSLVQLKDIVSPSELFDHYVYYSSNSDTMLASAQSLTERLIPTLPPKSTILEIASNDGYLL